MFLRNTWGGVDSAAAAPAPVAAPAATQAKPAAAPVAAAVVRGAHAADLHAGVLDAEFFP